MAAPYSTLALAVSNWDLYLDAGGSIAIVTPPYALEQDVASAAMTFNGEVYYDDSIGVLFNQILGTTPPLSLVKAQLSNAALTVPYVKTAKTIITGFLNRKVYGQIQFTDESGNTLAVSL